jgi:transcriptional regulator with XRE-family HTH domain
MTQEQFAEALGISVDFLSLVERGINAPSFDTLELPSGSGSPWPIYSPSNDARLS